MHERQVTVTSKHGLHARPAARFAQIAGTTASLVTVRKNGGDAVDARSLLSLLTLGIREGDQVVLAVDGEPMQLLDELAGLLTAEHEGDA